MKERIHKFLGRVSINFKRSKIAYDNYLKNGKTYIHARVLKEINEQIRYMLLESGFLLSEELIAEVLKIIAHYDIWIEKWNDLERNSNPKLDDEFVFSSEFIFPIESEKKLINEYQKIKMELI